MTTPNAGLAYKVLDHIDTHPEDWNQTRWWCGTSGCFAGWTCKLGGDDPSQEFTIVGGNRMVHISDRAARLLGFDDEDDLRWGADDEHPADLFASGNTRDDLSEIVEAVFGPRPGGAA